jgi:hypothetical protein
LAVAAPLLLALALGTLAGCGGSDSGPGIATVAGAAGQSSPTPGASADNQARMLQFAQCMRDHGQNVPDPDPNDGGGIKIVRSQGPDGPAISKDDAGFQAAMQACRQYLPNGGAPPSLSPEEQDQLRQFAQCMREHGVDMPDPDPNGGMLVRRTEGPGSKPDLVKDPEFEAAHEACKDKLPNRIQR